MKQAGAKLPLFLIVPFLAIQLAQAQCLICDSSGGYPYCAQAGLGAEFCITSSDPPYCQTRYDDCSSGCIPCDGGCCASLKDGKKSSCSIKKTAWQSTTVQTPPKREIDRADHLEDFLARADRGEFDGKTIYTHVDNTVVKGLMNLPLDHWKSFTQKIVMKGQQKDPHLSPQLQSEDRPQTILEIETKTGHKLVIHLIDESAIQKMQNQPQSKSEKPAIRDKL